MAEPEKEIPEDELPRAVTDMLVEKKLEIVRMASGFVSARLTDALAPDVFFGAHRFPRTMSRRPRSL